VYKDGADRTAKPLRVISQPGDGTGDSSGNPLLIVGLFDHFADPCVGLVAQVSDGRTVVDTAPDNGLIHVCNNDPNGGGAQGFGG
jgi:hypothetical protein